MRPETGRARGPAAVRAEKRPAAQEAPGRIHMSAESRDLKRSKFDCMAVQISLLPGPLRGSGLSVVSGGARAAQSRRGHAGSGRARGRRGDRGAPRAESARAADSDTVRAGR